MTKLLKLLGSLVVRVLTHSTSNEVSAKFSRTELKLDCLFDIHANPLPPPPVCPFIHVSAKKIVTIQGDNIIMDMAL